MELEQYKMNFQQRIAKSCRCQTISYCINEPAELTRMMVLAFIFSIASFCVIRKFINFARLNLPGLHSAVKLFKISCYLGDGNRD